jgi:hypothetical protein
MSLALAELLLISDAVTHWAEAMNISALAAIRASVRVDLFRVLTIFVSLQDFCLARISLGFGYWEVIWK